MSLAKTSTPADNAPGERIFALQLGTMRRARRLTLDQLADMTGLNKGYLSRLERAQKAPSIATVMKVAQALGVPVSALFGEVVDDKSIHVVRADRSKGASTPTGEAGFVTLSQSAAGMSMEAFLLFPGSEFRPRGQVHHGGTEMIFVVSGGIDIRFSDRTISFDAGDFIQFPGHILHQIRAPGADTRVLVVVSR